MAETGPGLTKIREQQNKIETYRENFDWWEGGVSLGSLFELTVEYSFEFQAFCTEVDEQTDVQIKPLEVVLRLRQVGRLLPSIQRR